MIQHLFPAKKTRINDLQNFNALCVCSYTTYSYLMNDMEYCYVALLTYLAVDCFFAQKDAFLHHIFGILLNSTIFTCGITNKEDIIALSRPFVKTEVSTIF